MDTAAFEIVAEVATGIAGFGTIAVVLGRDRAVWQSADLFRTAGLFVASLGALFLALLPIGLATAELAPETIWRVSSGVCAVWILASGALLRELRKRTLDPSLWLSPAAMTGIGATGFATVLSQALNAAGVGFAPNAACLFAGLVFLLALGCMFLLRIVFVRPAADAAR